MNSISFFTLKKETNQKVGCLVSPAIAMAKAGFVSQGMTLGHALAL